MKLSLAQLACKSFDLVSESERAYELHFRNIEDGKGELRMDRDLTVLEDVAIREMLATIDIPIGSGHLLTHVSASISHLTGDGRYRSGFVGEFRSSLIDCQRVALELEKVQVEGHLRAEQVHLKVDGRGGLVSIADLTLMDAHCRVGELLIKVGVINVSGLKVSWGEGRVRVEATKAHAKDLHLGRKGLAIDIASIVLEEGIRVQDSVEIPAILIDAVELSVDELRKQAPVRIENAADGPTPEEAPKEYPPITFDRSVFDTVNGQMDVDATLSVSLPVIGKRVATHHFRIPVEGGIVNYTDFERGLADLEDTFIGFNLRGSALVLERDIPLIPGTSKPILTWDLSRGDVTLAKQHLVRMRILPDFRRAVADSDKKSSVTLHRLDFDNINLELSIDETGVLTSGDGWIRAHVDHLEVDGSIHFDPDPEDLVRPTALDATAHGLGVRADTFLIRGHALSGHFDIGAVEDFHLGFQELSPTDLRFTFRKIRFADLRYDLDAAS